MSSSTTVFSDEKNPRGIPKAPFVADVEEYIGGPDADIEPPLKRIQEALAKYRYMDASLQQRKRGIEEKIPDIKKTLQMVEFLKDRRDGKGDDGDDNDLDDLDATENAGKSFKTTFELNDTLFAEAEIEDTDTVYLWLGANVMLSYPVAEAIDLLKSKLSTAETNLEHITEDLEFLREQITVMEVNTARLYNWDVKRRKERRLKEAESSAGERNEDR